MKNIGYGLVLIVLLSGCLPAASRQQPSSSPEDPSSPATVENVLEKSVDDYLMCTAEAAVDAVLDGASLVQSQLLLTEMCSARKVELLTRIGDDARPDFARRINDWDLSTLGAIRERLQNLEASLKVFMDCSYENVRAALSRDYAQPDMRFFENLVMQEISACYDNALGDLLHPRMPVQSAVGIARKDRVLLIAKERIMLEFYEEIRRREERDIPAQPQERNGKTDILAGAV
jgi:hypothetical protein